jgi:hypothetical protein
MNRRNPQNPGKGMEVMTKLSKDSTRVKARDLFTPGEISKIKNILEIFDGKVVAIYDTPKTESEARQQRESLALV